MEQIAFEKLPRSFNDQMINPVILKEISVVSREGNHFYRIKDNEGDVGVVQGNPKIATTLSMTKELIAPFFIGKDLRFIYNQMTDFYRHGSNYKYAGVPFWNLVSHLELAALDLMGKKTGKSLSELMGRELLRREIPLYLTNINRHDSPEVIMDYLNRLVIEHSFKAVKFKIGGRMNHNQDASEGWTDGMITTGRKIFDESIELYVDANSSYTPAAAIEVGKKLQDLHYQIFEEPIEWNNVPGHKTVADSLDIPVATGEQETNLHNFQWLMEQGGGDIIQPDLFYCGGLFRGLLISDMAAEKGLPVMPHSPKTGPAMLPMLHCVSMIRNPGRFHECLPPGEKTDWYTPQLKIEKGLMKIPQGPGLGIQIDPDYLKGGELLFTKS